MRLIGSRRNSVRETLSRPVIEPVRGWSATRKLSTERDRPGERAFIGLDVLRTRQSLRIDYLKNQVVLKMPDKYVEANSVNPKALVLRLTVQGQSMRFIVDTGLDGMLLYPDNLRSHSSKLKLTGKVSQVHLGRRTVERAELAGIRLGPEEEVQVPVLVLRGAPDTLLNGIDGFLGPSVLHAEVIELDFASGKLRWQ